MSGVQPHPDRAGGLRFGGLAGGRGRRHLARRLHARHGLEESGLGQVPPAPLAGEVEDPGDQVPGRVGLLGERGVERRHRRAVDAGVDVPVDVQRLGAAPEHAGGEVGGLGGIAPRIGADVLLGHAASVGPMALDAALDGERRLAGLDVGGGEVRHRGARLDDLVPRRLPLADDRLDQLGHGLGIDLAVELGGIGERVLQLAAMRQGQDVVDHGLQVILGHEVERRHRRAHDPPAYRADQVLAERLGAVGGRGEFEDPRAVIARLGQHVDGGRAVAVAGDAVALAAVLRVEHMPAPEAVGGGLAGAQELDLPGRPGLLGEDAVDRPLELGVELLDALARSELGLRLPRTADRAQAEQAERQPLQNTLRHVEPLHRDERTRLGRCVGCSQIG